MTIQLETPTVAAPQASRRRHRSGPRGLRARVAQQIVKLAARDVPVDIALPDGTLLNRPTGSGVERRPRIELHRPEAFFRRVAEQPKIGIGEGYTAGEWDAAPGSDLADVLAPYAERLAGLLPDWLLRLRGLVDQPIPADQHGAVEHTQENIAAHYT